MKFTRKIIALLLALLTVSGLFAFHAGAGLDVDNKPAIIIGGAVNVRENPGEDSQRIGGLTYGKMVFVTDTVTADGKIWYKINYEGANGYILSTYAALLKDIGMVNAGAVNIRKEASESSERIAGLSYGKPVWIIGEVKNGSDTWYKFLYKDGDTYTNAYIKSNYVGIMALPESFSAKATYKNDITVCAYYRNVPVGYQVITGTNTQVAAEGAAEFCGIMPLGNLEDSRLVTLRIYDPSGNLMLQKAVSIEVDNSFFGKIIAFFGFIFNGFKWGSQNVEVR